MQHESECKPTLVFLHGWGLNRAIWQQLWPYLPEFEKLALDLPGFGERPVADEPTSIHSWAASLVEALPRRCVLVGWSLGGLVATELARCFPEQVQGLVLVASSPCFVEQPHWPGMQVQVLTQFAKLLVDDPAKTVERFLAIQAMGSETARQDVKTIKAAIQTLPAPDPAALAAGLQLLLDVDLRSTLSHLQQPLAGIYGRLDALVPASQLNELQRLCPHGTWELLPKASHAPFITHPQQFSDWLRQVLQQWSRQPL